MMGYFLGERDFYHGRKLQDNPFNESLREFFQWRNGFLDQYDLQQLSENSGRFKNPNP